MHQLRFSLASCRPIFRKPPLELEALKALVEIALCLHKLKSIPPCNGVGGAKVCLPAARYVSPEPNSQYLELHHLLPALSSQHSKAKHRTVSSMASGEDMDALNRVIIESVIENVRTSFINMGIDEQVLIDLQESWESKLRQSKQKFVQHPTSTDDESQEPAPTINDQFTLNRRTTISSTSVHSSSSILFSNSGSTNADVSQDALPADPSQIRPPHGMSIAQLQTRGTRFSEVELDEIVGPPKRLNNQLDGINDGQSETQDLDNSQPSSYSNHYGGSSSFNPDNNSSSLDSTGSSEEEEVIDEEEIENLILCQYEKVTRTKNKWKCILKDGMLHINDQDYAFHRATCDFEW